MTEHHEAVVLILDRLKTQGLEWYRTAKFEDVDLFERRISGSFSIFDGGEIHTIGRKLKSHFPAKKILVMPPSGCEKEEILGLWLRWDFVAEPFEFRLFLGQWSEIEGKKPLLPSVSKRLNRAKSTITSTANPAEISEIEKRFQMPRWSRIDSRRFP